MVEKKTEEQDIYSSGKQSKIADFFIGVGIYLAISFIFSFIIGIVNLIMTLSRDSSSLINSLAFSMLGSFSIVSWILSVVVSLIIAKKYFQGRRLVSIGIWVAFLLPILIILILFGACLIAFSNSGW